jgi:hypothetical protein
MLGSKRRKTARMHDTEEPSSWMYLSCLQAVNLPVQRVPVHAHREVSTRRHSWQLYKWSTTMLSVYSQQYGQTAATERSQIHTDTTKTIIQQTRNQERFIYTPAVYCCCCYLHRAKEQHTALACRVSEEGRKERV